MNNMLCSSCKAQSVCLILTTKETRFTGISSKLSLKCGASQESVFVHGNRNTIGYTVFIPIKGAGMWIIDSDLVTWERILKVFGLLGLTADRKMTPS